MLCRHVVAATLTQVHVVLPPCSAGMWWLPTAGELLEQGPLGGRPGVGGAGQQGLLTAIARDLTLDLGDGGADLLQVWGRGAQRGEGPVHFDEGVT